MDELEGKEMYCNYCTNVYTAIGVRVGQGTHRRQPGNQGTHAEGNHTEGNQGTHAEGNHTEGNQGTHAEGNHTEGNQGTHAEGNHTDGNQGTHAEGNQATKGHMQSRDTQKATTQTGSEGKHADGNQGCVEFQLNWSCNLKNTYIVHVQ